MRSLIFTMSMLPWLLLGLMVAPAVGAQGPFQAPRCLASCCWRETAAPETAWQHWLKHPPPAKQLLARPPADFATVEPTQTPSTPEDNPFEDQLTVLDEGQMHLGLSGGRGFNLRNFPRTIAQWQQLLRLRNLLRLGDWVQPESNELRMQNLVGASFYFYF